MARIARKITLTEKQESLLRVLSNSRTAPVHLQQRSSIILRCAEGKTNLLIMEELGIHKKTISKWRSRWLEHTDRLLALDQKEKGMPINAQSKAF